MVERDSTRALTNVKNKLQSSLPYGLLVGMEPTIHDYVAAVGTTRELANLLGLDDQQGFWRVSQWHSRGVIPKYARFEFASHWRTLDKRIERSAVAQAAQVSA